VFAVTEPVIGSLLGLIIYHERLRGGPGQIAVELAACTAATWGIARLAGSGAPVAHRRPPGRTHPLDPGRPVRRSLRAAAANPEHTPGSAPALTPTIAQPRHYPPKPEQIGPPKSGRAMGTRVITPTTRTARRWRTQITPNPVLIAGDTLTAFSPLNGGLARVGQEQA
jgi:hypothetical protein